MLRHISALALLLFASTAPARGQVVPPPDSAAMVMSAARAALSYWEASSHGSSEQSVYLKNNSTRPIVITSYEVYECVNIPRRVCGVHTPGPTVPPGKTVILVTISRSRNDQAWAYHYKFFPQFAPDTVAADSGKQ
jgi:hypothetical protein